MPRRSLRGRLECISRGQKENHCPQQSFLFSLPETCRQNEAGQVYQPYDRKTWGEKANTSSCKVLIVRECIGKGVNTATASTAHSSGYTSTCGRYGVEVLQSHWRTLSHVCRSTISSLTWPLVYMYTLPIDEAR